MAIDGYEELERMLAQFGLHHSRDLARAWAEHGFVPAEMAEWLIAGVAANEPHIAAALAAAEWSPRDAGRQVRQGEPLTFVQAVRHHPHAAAYALELRWATG